MEKLEKPVQGGLTERCALRTGLHAKQPRKGTQIPYFAHLMAVVSIVMEAGADEDEATAARAARRARR